MKHVKRLASLLLAMVMVLAMGVTSAFAAESYGITVVNTSDSTSMEGNTYRVYKLFDVTYSDVDNVVGTGNYAYTVTEDFAEFSYNGMKGEGLIAYLGTLNDNAEELDHFAKTALEYAQYNGIQPANEVIATDGNYTTITLKSAGYYLVTGSVTADGEQKVVAACALTTTDPKAEVNVKADAPRLDKKIVEGEELVSANTAAIGDTVEFQLSSKVPNMTGYDEYTYRVYDTLSEGLTFDGEKSLTVKIGEETLQKGLDYILYVNDQELVIEFNDFIRYKEQTREPITITYSATLNEKANLGSEGNPNRAHLEYSNNPNVSKEVGTTPEVETKTYVTGIQIDKVDGMDKTKMLAGAKFSIEGEALKVVLTNKEMYKPSDNGTYYMLKDGTYTEKQPTDENAANYDSTTQKYEKVEVVSKETITEEINTVGYTNEKGILTFEGLGEGTYVIRELVAPNGYNLLKDEIKVTISAQPDMTGANWSVNASVGDTEIIPGLNDNDLYTLEIQNNSGNELPSTGGMGTTLFYALGGVLAVGAAVLLVVKKRMGRTAQ